MDDTRIRSRRPRVTDRSPIRRRRACDPQAADAADADQRRDRLVARRSRSSSRAAGARRRTHGEFCTHRDVLPFAGKEGFKPESWCPECAFYKLRRTPKKRERNDTLLSVQLVIRSELPRRRSRTD